MTTFVLLTRLLLCLSLVLNGTGSAVLPMQALAGDHARAAADHVPAAESAPSLAHAGMPMHGHAGHAGMAMASCHDTAPPPTGCGDGAQDHGGGKDSCCTSAASCQCPHAQPLPALTAMPVLSSPALRLAVPAVRQHERGSPGLPRLDRPPIA